MTCPGTELVQGDGALEGIVMEEDTGESILHGTGGRQRLGVQLSGDSVTAT